MSIFEDARVTLLLADYASVGLDGKISMIGGAFSVAPMRPTDALSPPQYIVCFVDVPVPQYVGQSFAFSLDLHNVTADAPVQVAMPSGEPTAVRVQQMMTVAQANPTVAWPDGMWQRMPTVLAATDGFPLQLGNIYAWRVSIDGSHHPDWQARFVVPGPPAGPVFGGPVNPTDLSLPSI